MKIRKQMILSTMALLLVCGCSAFQTTSLKLNDVNVTTLTTTSKSIDDVDAQASIATEISEKKEASSYTIDDPLLIYDPYDTNTTSLYLYFETTEAVSVSYTVHVKDRDIEDFTRTLSSTASKKHEYQLLGLIPDMENIITLQVKDSKGVITEHSFSYQMGSLKGEEEIILEKSEGTSKATVSDGLYVILGNDSSGNDFMYYYDNNGVLRGEVPINGYRVHRLIYQNNLVYMSISDTQIAAMNALGQVEKVYDLGKYQLHHDYIFDDSGDMLILATDTTKDTVEDQIIRLDLESGKITQSIDLGDLFASYKASTTQPTEEDTDWDWMHINTIQNMGNGKIMLSSRETSTIIVLEDFDEDPSISYLIGEESFWEASDYADLLLQKQGTFTSQTGQHSLTYVKDNSLPDGQYYVYMFNNNYGYSKTQPDYDWSQLSGIATKSDQSLVNSKYYKYLVDEINGTYRLVDSFDVPFSSYVSSVQNIGGNTVVDSGMKSDFQEYDSTHTLIQSFEMEAETFIYRVYKYDFNGFYFNT